MSATGSFIWYELMTTDATAAAKFYDAVVGWKITDRFDSPDSELDYRMIGRSDGGYNGGVLALTADMVEHGAHPTWLGYLHVADVDAAVEAIEADGGKVLMPRKDLPVGAMAMVTDPMGTPFYVMAPIPPPGKPDAKSDVFDATSAQHVRWNELASPDQRRAKAVLFKAFRLRNSRTACRWARWVAMTSSITAAYGLAQSCRSPRRARTPHGSSTSGSSRSPRRRQLSNRAAAES